MPKLDGKAILLVEDEAIIAFDIETELKNEGATVVSAPSVTSALIAIQSGTFDAAIVDHALQDGDGSQICHQLHHHKIPFLVYSGYHLIHGPCEHAPHISKPAGPGVIVDTLVSIIDPKP